MTTEPIPASGSALPPFEDDALCVELRRARALTAADLRFCDVTGPGMNGERLQHFCETQAMIAAARVLLDAAPAQLEVRL